MEIVAFVLSIISLIFSIPSMILSIIHICKEKLNIDFKLDGDIFGDDAVFLRKKGEIYFCSSTFLLTNKTDQTYTLHKIIVLDGKREEELIISTAYGESSFNNIPLSGNEALYKLFHFQISKPETKKLTFKIYTNKKIFKKKLKYKLD